ncbi:MAG: hypothetical protein U1A27_04745 [Phycisphaerae bacterium]
MAHCLLVLISWATLSLGQQPAPPGSSAGDDVQAPFVDPAATREQYEGEARNQARFYARAYQLSNDEAGQLEQRFLALVDQAVDYDVVIRVTAARCQKAFEAERARHGDDWNPTPEELKKYLDPVTDTDKNSPMRGEILQKIVEQGMPEDRVTKGRERMNSTAAADWTSADDTHNAEAIQAATHAAQIRAETEMHARADADLSPAGNPMPKAEYMPPPAPIIARNGKVLARMKVESDVLPRKSEQQRMPPRTGSNEGNVTAPTPVAPAPPLDEWDRHVDGIAQRYKFDDGQKAKAQAILKDLRTRAEQYRRSRGDEFERVKKIEAVTVREQELKALNKPLDELFAELKERLDELPTQAQREAAGPATPQPPAKK